MKNIFNKNNMIYLFLIAIIINSLTPIAIKTGIEELPLFALLASRFLLGSLLLRFFFPIKMKNFKILFLNGMIAFVYMSMSFYSFKIFSPGLVNLISEIPFSIIFATIMLKESISRRAVYGIVIAFIGLFLVTSEVHLGDKEYLILIPLLSAILWGYAVNLTKKLTLEIEAGEVLTIKFFSVGICSLVASLIFETGQTEAFLSLSNSGWIGIVWLVLITSSLKYIMIKTYQQLPMHIITPITMMLPVLVLFWDYVFFGNMFNTSQLIGTAVIIIGVYMAEHKPSKHKDHKKRKHHLIHKNIHHH